MGGSFIVFAPFIFQIDVSSDIPRGIFIPLYRYERLDSGTEIRKYIFIYNNIFHRMYVSSFQTQVKTVFK